MEAKQWIAGEPRTPDPEQRWAGRAARYGDGVFATLACEDGILLDVEEQLGRLAAACDRIGIRVPAAAGSVDALVDALRALGGAGHPDFVARVQVSAAPSGRGYGRESGGEGWELIELFPPPAARACRAALAGPDSKLPVPAVPDVKSCSALAHVLAASEARRLGVDELIRTTGGLVTEAIAANVFWLADGVLYTPDSALPLYPGVTRGVVLRVAAALGEMEEGEFPPAAIRRAEAVFLTNATRGIEPVVEIDGESIAWPEALESLVASVKDARREAGVRL